MDGSRAWTVVVISTSHWVSIQTVKRGEHEKDVEGEGGWNEDGIGVRPSGELFDGTGGGLRTEESWLGGAWIARICLTASPCFRPWRPRPFLQGIDRSGDSALRPGICHLIGSTAERPSPTSLSRQVQQSTHAKLPNFFTLLGS